MLKPNNYVQFSVESSFDKHFWINSYTSIEVLNNQNGNCFDYQPNITSGLDKV